MDHRQADDEHVISFTLRHLNSCSFNGDIVCGIIATDCRKSSAISVRSADDAECVIESRDTILVMSVSDLDSTVVVSYQSRDHMLY
jgi:hypothetical protein